MHVETTLKLGQHPGSNPGASTNTFERAWRQSSLNPACGQMNWYELEDGYYLAKKDGETKIIQIGTSKKLVSMGCPPNVYKSIIVMGRMGSPSEVAGCDFKRIILEEL